MDHSLVRALRSHGVDVLTVAEAGRTQLSDGEQLMFAASEGRTLYTSNVGDFARLHRRWLDEERHHAGLIVLVDQLTDIGVQLRALLHICQALDPTEMEDRLEF